MRIVLQRVRRAAVAVDGEEIAAIGPGLLALVGIAVGDEAEDARRLADRTARLRVLASAERPFDASLLDVPGAALLCVSQFTLLADLRRGNRPSWSGAAPPEVAAPLVEAYAEAVAAHGIPVERGRFAAAMVVTLENDGPVTIVLDSREPRRGGDGA
jgi:D-tyrosyl-tRNA(Tyr) deacylase